MKHQSPDSTKLAAYFLVSAAEVISVRSPDRRIGTIEDWRTLLLVSQPSLESLHAAHVDRTVILHRRRASSIRCPDSGNRPSLGSAAGLISSRSSWDSPVSYVDPIGLSANRIATIDRVLSRRSFIRTILRALVPERSCCSYSAEVMFHPYGLRICFHVDGILCRFSSRTDANWHRQSQEEKARSADWKDKSGTATRVLQRMMSSP